MGEQPIANDIELLRDFWYLAVPGRRLRRGRMMPKTVLGEPLLLMRTPEGTPHAVRDICPHRGMPLHHGHFDGNQVTCPYHGWRFAADGRCTEVPSLTPDQNGGATRIKLKSYPCREVQGNIWVYISDDRRAEGAALPDVPLMPGIGDRSPQVDCSLVYPLDADNAAYTLMDPAHAAFVHTWWWWKKGRTNLREKRKDFEAAPLGWRQKRHAAPAANRMYRIFGKQVTTEISYRLPGMRIEHVEGERHVAVSLLTITPIDAERTEVHQCLYSTVGWLAPVKPVLRRLIYKFLDQDREVAELHRDGLAYDPPMMLFGDVDAQAKWFFRLKREWTQSQAENRPFSNPIEAQTLRWRS